MSAATLVQDEHVPGAVGGDWLKYQLTVVAPSVADAVAYSGGWLFDRVMAGWEVSVLIPRPGDIRPLSILGTRVFDLDEALGSARKGFRPEAIAVAADIFSGDGRVHREVMSALRRGSTEVSFWGDTAPVAVERHMTAVDHPLTAAAQAFKSHALALASAPTRAVAATERFFTSGTSYRGW